MTPENLHRVVFTPADGETAKRFLPASPASTGARPEDLWNWLEMTSDRLGIDFVAIPHNSNLSLGLMFDMVDSEGRPISAEYARTRHALGAGGGGAADQGAPLRPTPCSHRLTSSQVLRSTRSSSAAESGTPTPPPAATRAQACFAVSTSRTGLG